MRHPFDIRRLWPAALAWCFLLGAQAAPPGSAAGDAVREMEQLQSRIRPWMSRELGIPEARIAFAPVDQRLRIGACEEALVFDFAFANRDLVRVRCRVPEWQLFIRTVIQEERAQVVAARALSTGTVITESDLALRIVDARAVDGFADRSRLVGRMVRRTLQEGMVLQPGDLDQALPVFRVREGIRTGQVIDAASLARELVPASSMGGLLPATGLPGQDSVALRDLEPGRILTSDDWSAGQRALVARQNLPAGRVLEAALFERSIVAARTGTPSLLSEWSALEQVELTRPLRAGEPLPANAVRPVLLVQRGKPVLLTRGRPGAWELSLRTEALEDGRFGERVRLRNPESGRTVSARVTARDAAQLDD